MATWKIDPDHSATEFVIEYMMFATIRGSFADIEGILEYDAHHPEKSSISVRIRTDSVYTGSKDRDAHLRNKDFFNSEVYPYITFESTNLHLDEGEKSGVLTGTLNLVGITKSVDIRVNMIGDGYDPAGHRRLGFKGLTTINREDFGLTWNQSLEKGGVLVGRDVKIELTVQAMLMDKVTEDTPAFTQFA